MVLQICQVLHMDLEVMKVGTWTPSERIFRKWEISFSSFGKEAKAALHGSTHSKLQTLGTLSPQTLYLNENHL